jgi:hypothetical protein
MSALDQKLDLILRGQHILMRASFSPNDPQNQAKHFVGLQTDITAWFGDYPTIVGLDVQKAEPTTLGSTEIVEGVDPIR